MKWLLIIITLISILYAKGVFCNGFNCKSPDECYEKCIAEGHYPWKCAWQKFKSVAKEAVAKLALAYCQKYPSECPGLQNNSNFTEKERMK